MPFIGIQRDAFLSDEDSKGRTMSKKRLKPLPCQLYTISQMSGGLVELGSMSLPKRIKFWLKRKLNVRTKRKIKKMTDSLLLVSSVRKKEIHMETDKNEQPVISETHTTELKNQVSTLNSNLKSGDLVRVRSRTEIESMLDGWNELKGCAVMPAMWQYCGTTQRVFKVVERFVDERDYRLKKGTGIILLEGLICGGTLDYGRCDRSCFYFWRVEWLERVEST
jgi:hypothetical protein